MIDLTLDALMVPAIDGYTPVIGTKVTATTTNKGGLSTQQVAENIAMPFIKQRAIVVDSTETTSAVEYDASIIINAAGVTLTLGNGVSAGIEIDIFAQYQATLVIGSDSYTLMSGNDYKFFWTGSAWKLLAGSCYSCPIGSVYPFAGATVPVGYLLCDGSALNESDYPNLYAVIADLYLPSGTTKESGVFYLPDFRNRFLQGAESNLGTSIAAGLPNIKGEIAVYAGGYASGAFSKTSGNHDELSSSSSGSVFSFDASKSSAVYQDDCTTVQPPAVAVNYIIKY